MEPLGAVVVGAAQAGLAVNYYLREANRAYVVLERARPDLSVALPGGNTLIAAVPIEHRNDNR